MSKEKILIVGGAGYIGSYVNHMLQKEGYSTLIFDDFSRGDLKAITPTPFVKGSLQDYQKLCQLFKNNSISTVMHFAAFTDVGESTRLPEKYYQNNVVGSLNLLNAMVRHGVKQLVFSSSAAVFGHPQTPFIDETHPFNPVNPYGQSKLMVERILKDYEEAYELKSCSLRYLNAAGGDPKGELKNYQRQITNLIPLVLKGLKQNNPLVKIYGDHYPTLDGTCVRDYIHLFDLATAHLLAMQHLKKNPGSCHYNLGIGKGYSVKQVLQAIEEVTKKKLKITVAPVRKGDPASLIADANKAQQELRWTPKYRQIETMIKHAWLALDYKEA